MKAEIRYIDEDGGAHTTVESARKADLQIRLKKAFTSTFSGFHADSEAHQFALTVTTSTFFIRHLARILNNYLEQIEEAVDE